MNEKRRREDDDRDACESAERREEERDRILFLSVEIHKDWLEEEKESHQCGGEDEEAEHRHRDEDGVRLFTRELRAVRNEEHDPYDVEGCKDRIRIRVLDYDFTIPLFNRGARTSLLTRFSTRTNRLKCRQMSRFREAPTGSIGAD